jgi:DNA ligase D-like protein (predicted 3'-phosphoesterase)
MTLKEYQKKRNLQKTPEPPAKKKSSSSGRTYSIQEHHASRLHWDLRLEKDGVLKSWALPKEPPSQPGIRRLAVQTEDHPLDYALFEGEIPAGQYGAGTVQVWDQGQYQELEYLEGEKFIIELQGKKLSGVYCLIHLKKGKNDWLFFKKSKPS